MKNKDLIAKLQTFDSEMEIGLHQESDWINEIYPLINIDNKIELFPFSAVYYCVDRIYNLEKTIEERTDNRKEQVDKWKKEIAWIKRSIPLFDKQDIQQILNLINNSYRMDSLTRERQINELKSWL